MKTYTVNIGTEEINNEAGYKDYQYEVHAVNSIMAAIDALTKLSHEMTAIEVLHTIHVSRGREIQ